MMASYTTATVATMVPTVTASDEHQVAVVVPIVTSEEMSRQVRTVLQEYTKEHNHGSTLSLQEDHCNQHYTSGTTVAVPARRTSSPAVLMKPATRSTLNSVSLSAKYTPITFDSPTHFSIRNNWYRKSNPEHDYCPTTVITGGPKNSNAEMFSVTRLGEGGKVVVFKDIRATLNHGKTNHTPLLLMRNQQGHVGGYKVELCNVVVDPSDPTNANLWRGLPICTIERKFCNCSIRDLYDIELVGPLATKNNESYVDCEGKLPKKIVLWNEKENGNGIGGGTKKSKKFKNKVASLQKKLFRSHWKVNISQGEDVLLLIAITCTIDRIRQEFEWGCM